KESTLSKREAPPTPSEQSVRRLPKVRYNGPRMHASEIVNELDNVLPNSPYVRPGGSLLLMVGLPGAGKSFLVDCLSKLVPCVIIRTDQVRLYIRQEPTYTAAEMMYTYEICYQVVAARLEKGQRVVFDASNYLAARR